MANERLILLVPLFLMLCDFWTAITPPKVSHTRHNHESHQPDLQSFKFVEGKDSASRGGRFHISFCTSCSFRNQALRTKQLLESSFPGAVVTLSNYPPAAYKRMLGKLVPVAQFGSVAIVFAGEQIFPMLGYSAPPPWYFSLRQNKLGTVATSWLLGNFLQNALLNTGAFEVFYDGDLVFSKVQSKRFPTDDELRESIGKVFVRKTSDI